MSSELEHVCLVPFSEVAELVEPEGNERLVEVLNGHIALGVFG